jgi:hypothetical protein
MRLRLEKKIDSNGVARTLQCGEVFEVVPTRASNQRVGLIWPLGSIG